MSHIDRVGCGNWRTKVPDCLGSRAIYGRCGSITEALENSQGCVSGLSSREFLLDRDPGANRFWSKIGSFGSAYRLAHWINVELGKCLRSNLSFEHGSRRTWRYINSRNTTVMESDATVKTKACLSFGQQNNGGVHSSAARNFEFRKRVIGVPGCNALLLGYSDLGFEPADGIASAIE